MPVMKKKRLPGLLLPLLLIACSPSNQAQSAPPPPAAVAAAPADTPTRVGVQLPDFVSLVEKEGPAVVNISTTQIIRGRAPFPLPPGLTPDDPMFEWFRRFPPS